MSEDKKYPKPGTQEADDLFNQFREEALKHTNYAFPIHPCRVDSPELGALLKSWEADGRIRGRKASEFEQRTVLSKELTIRCRAWPCGAERILDDELKDILKRVWRATHGRGNIILRTHGLDGVNRQYAWRLYELGYLRRNINSNRNFHWK